MNPQMGPLSPGLYLVATPIGTARDITLRSLDILSSADVLAAEDTRSLKRLLEIHGVILGDRPLVSYHDHNGHRVRPRLIAEIKKGKSVVYASEAGTPLVADPGYDLVQSMIEEGLPIVSAPGPSAVITALTLAGLPTDQFFFAGFLPSASSKRKTALRTLTEIPGTLVFYESPKRISAMLRDASDVLGADRKAAICRELTKKFEEVLRGSLEELDTLCQTRGLKGEIVVLIDRGTEQSANAADVEAALESALETLSVKDAATQVSRETGWKRREVYQLALKKSEQR